MQVGGTDGYCYSYLLLLLLLLLLVVVVVVVVVVVAAAAEAAGVLRHYSGYLCLRKNCSFKSPCILQDESNENLKYIYFLLWTIRRADP